MANSPYSIRTPSLGDGGETLKQAHSLALVMASSDQLEDSARDAAVLILDLLEKAHGQIAAKYAPVAA